MPLSRNQIHTQVYEYTLILIAVSLPLSIFTSSMFQLLLLANCLVELRYPREMEKARLQPGPAAIFTDLRPACGGIALVVRPKLRHDGHQDQASPARISCDHRHLSTSVHTTAPPHFVILLPGGIFGIHGFGT